MFHLTFSAPQNFRTAHAETNRGIDSSADLGKLYACVETVWARAMEQFPDDIRADGIHLRPMRIADLATVITHLNNLEIARWMAAVRHPFGMNDAEEVFTLSCEPSRRIRVVERGGAMVGCLGLSPDVWFWLDPSARGQGIMLGALRAAVAEHFARQAPPLVATCRDDNPASQRLLSRLGFSRMPVGRRMFFACDAASQPCHDHVLTPEQWLMLHPPLARSGSLTLRPAMQKDAASLLQMLPTPGAVDSERWPQPEALSAFIETHRCRTPGRGLFVAQDEDRRIVGMAIVDASALSCFTCFLTAEDAERHAEDLSKIRLLLEQNAGIF